MTTDESGSRSDRYRLLFTRRSVVSVALILLLSVWGASLHVLDLEATMVESMSVNHAKLYTRALTEFRTLYSSEVVARARTSGATVTHDYLNQPGAIPLPATLSLLIGNRMSEGAETSTRLYSDYPFPWREAEGGVRDSFGRRALELLRNEPEQSISEVMTINERSVLRYATADRMRPSCVTCHNTHPDSPKTDWKVGDVRGVLEVMVPLDSNATEARDSLRTFVPLAATIVLFGLAVLALFSFRLRKEALAADQLAATTAKMNLSLQREISDRERAEADRRDMEAQVRYTQKLEGLGLLAGGIAHDFNNLLMGVLGHASIAGEGLGSPSPAEQSIEEIEKAVLRARDLTGQLLAYAGKGSFQRRAINLSAFIKDIGPLLATTRRKGTRLRFELAPETPAIEVDPVQLQQILLNLATNAIDATESTEDVWIRTGLLFADKKRLEHCSVGQHLPEGDYVFLEVEDKGIGIASETLERIFDPFFTTKSEGRGLGLAALQGIVRGHDGALEVQSSTGEGTTFRVLFPPTSKTPAPPIPLTSKPDAAPAGQTILVVDDDDEVRTITSSLLSRVGSTVLQASSGEEALQLISAGEQRFDTIVMDLRMPGIGGAETCRAIRKLNSEVFILLASGYGLEDDVEELVKDPRIRFLQKPFGLSELLEELSLLTEGHE